MSYEEYNLIRILLQILKPEEPPLPWQGWMEGFLEHLADSHGHVSTAIDRCEVSRDTVYRYRRRNEQFAQRWEATIEAVEEDRRAARRRGRTAKRAAVADPPQAPARGGTEMKTAGVEVGECRGAAKEPIAGCRDEPT